MFDSTRPPLLVQPISAHHLTLFPTHEGYNLHPINNNQTLVCYKQGWTFPLSLQMQALTTDEPLLLIRDKGGRTSSGSASEKGYSHQFCCTDGNPIDPWMKLQIFPDKPSEEWMLARSPISVVWLQYSSNTEYLGTSGHNTVHFYSGKLLIRDFIIQHAFAPRLDRASDVVTAGEKQYRLESNKTFEDSWSLADEDVAQYLEKTLSDSNLEHYWPAVSIALKRALT